MQVEFPLTLTEVPARFAIRADGSLDPKDYVLKVSFAGVDMTRDLAKELNLHFSHALDAIYLYNRGQSVGRTGFTSFFHLPDGATKLTVEVLRWAKKAEVAHINGIDLQIQAPWSKMNKLTQIGVTINDG
ncbi:MULTISPECIES: hypothetical protein [unclassified Corynebacterium]|uniref:hypothetical protein n=1 Tax=unclassified Corynebacterium TaxID=2624378 RepID=UPI001EF5C19F|nr:MULTISPECIES: hypothetical protein [unclassified Corynebacterium]MCG7290050.1 hypothetical protein [Corynebacterium sp. ACRPZ]MCG7294095.1 hypothetical protein [Corynebacterium sp. ACRPY]